MAFRVFILTVTVALNAALLASFAFRPKFVPTKFRDIFTRRAIAREPGVPERTPKQTIAVQQTPDAAAIASDAIWSRLYSPDLATLLSHLRAAGFPPALVRSIIDAEVERQFSPRTKDLTRTLNETPFWKPDPSYYLGNSKLFEEINQVYRERSRVLRNLLGQDAYASAVEDPTARQRQQYGNLAPAKFELMQRIDDDYAEMTGQIRAAMQGVTLPEDSEKLALLEREKRADLAAILSSEELADYDLRTSPITMRLRPTFTVMEAREAEFRAIYQAHESFKDLLYPTNNDAFSYVGSDLLKRRREATSQINQQLQTALGDARYAEYQRASDSEFQQLYRLGQRDNIAYDTLVRAHDTRRPITEAATKIIDDSTLTADAKLSGLKNLAQEGRTRLLSTLGPAAGPTYVENSRWLNYLDQGRVLVALPDGSNTVRSVPIVSLPQAPAPRR